MISKCFIQSKGQRPTISPELAPSDSDQMFSDGRNLRQTQSVSLHLAMLTSFGKITQRFSNCKQFLTFPPDRFLIFPNFRGTSSSIQSSSNTCRLPTCCSGPKKTAQLKPAECAYRSGASGGKSAPRTDTQWLSGVSSQAGSSSVVSAIESNSHLTKAAAGNSGEPRHFLTKVPRWCDGASAFSTSTVLRHSHWKLDNWILASSEKGSTGLSRIFPSISSHVSTLAWLMASCVR